MSSLVGSGVLSGGNQLTVDRELRYVVQWFTEWSDFQRDDFVPVLASYLAKANPGGPVYVNGIIGGMASVSGEDKPMSLFQCRVKLFNEWCTKWPESHRDSLLERLTEIDPEFSKQVKQELTGSTTNTAQGFDLDLGGDPAPISIELSSPPEPAETSPEPTVAPPLLLVIGED